MLAIEVNNLKKQYDNGVQALNGLNLSVRSGEVFSLLGTNGAGKSTLINILTTLLQPSSGSAKIFGKDIYNDVSQIRPIISCVSQKNSIDSHLSLRENLILQSKLYKIPKSEAEEQINLLISSFDLQKYLDYPVSSYSGGIKRRLNITLSLMSKPKLLFLDEPTVGMDVQSRKAMWDIIRNIKEELHTTVFLTTHYLEEAEELSDSLGIVSNGKLVQQGTPNSLKKYLSKDMMKISFSTSKNAADCLILLEKEFSFNELQLNNCTITSLVNNGEYDLQKTNKFLIDKNIPITGISLEQPSLEDVFVNIINNNRMGGI